MEHVWLLMRSRTPDFSFAPAILLPSSGIEDVPTATHLIHVSTMWDDPLSHPLPTANSPPTAELATGDKESGINLL